MFLVRILPTDEPFFFEQVIVQYDQTILVARKMLHGANSRAERTWGNEFCAHFLELMKDAEFVLLQKKQAEEGHDQASGEHVERRNPYRVILRV